MGRLEGKVAFITGAGAGIGRASAQKFVTEGARVVVAELNDRCALLTVVGPMSADILRNSGLMEVVELDVGSHRVFGFDGRPVVAAHTSEYAVLGVNLIVDEGVAGQVWATISRTTVAPCGSRASDAVLVQLGRVKSV